MHTLSLGFPQMLPLVHCGRAAVRPAVCAKDAANEERTCGSTARSTHTHARSLPSVRLCPPCRTQARNQLRRQVGTLRFDLNTLAQTKAKEDKKKALQLRKEFITKVRTNELCSFSLA